MKQQKLLRLLKEMLRNSKRSDREIARVLPELELNWKKNT